MALLPQQHLGVKLKSDRRDDMRMGTKDPCIEHLLCMDSILRDVKTRSRSSHRSLHACMRQVGLRDDCAGKIDQYTLCRSNRYSDRTDVIVDRWCSNIDDRRRILSVVSANATLDTANRDSRLRVNTSLATKDASIGTWHSCTVDRLSMLLFDQADEMLCIRSRHTLHRRRTHSNLAGDDHDT